ncbi:MAG TPA: hypothetical protein VM847_02980, partial [Tahibacter sp.]|nr:hypothetical protein [Tahibacter sp.]
MAPLPRPAAISTCTGRSGDIAASRRRRFLRHRAAERPHGRHSTVSRVNRSADRDVIHMWN